MKRLLGAFVFLVSLSACSDGGEASGPGSLTAHVLSAEGELGSAVVQVIGQGVQGIEASGGSRVVVRQTGTDTYRVLVVNTGTGGLAFRVRVEDLAAQRPTAAVFSAASTANELVASNVPMSVTLEP